METYLLDWANLLLRWLHVITAIAWIGSSFYFVFLDSNLLAPTAEDLKEKGVDGAIWSVHGGGFYHAQKYMVAPKGGIDSHLHWFYWESYWTWISGFLLFVVLYLWNAGIFLVDKQVFDWSPMAAGIGALVFLAAFWFIYDAICRIFGQHKNGDRIVGALVLLVVVCSSWIAFHLFSGRAAFLMVGASLATAMSANVFFWIIPGQRKVVAAMTSGQPYNPADYAIYGKRGKQRSVHNTYFTLPVLVAMISNHYSFLYASEHRWVLLMLLMLAGALIRQFFVQRHGWKLGRASNPWPFAAIGVVVLLALIAWLKPAPAAPAAALPETVDYAQIKPILEQRCYICHGEAVQQKGIRVDSPEQATAHAQNIYQQVVVTKQMPLSNATGMTDDERAMVGRWFESQNK
ncbi:MAG TPA: urate hydroxylase PuuD [Ottowia sp.]|uniref:urate hydroxylase PuuD n=1 Tax=Ottowia sp. TaxID=1898956 RepID=UPI002C6C5782|nr:urate hydroxylase PuuD [Ottowia sp.]HMN22054.1 urate hydroxylase PuuD [Ottowia sp.]